jgi:hypothetical protein
VALVFIETSVFTKQVNRLMNDDEYTKLQVSLIRKPDIGKVIQGTGGIRKMRWAGSGRGKRGGSRIIYYWVKSEHQIFMLMAYPKNEKDELNTEERKALRQLVEAWLK